MPVLAAVYTPEFLHTLGCSQLYRTEGRQRPWGPAHVWCPSANSPTWLIRACVKRMRLGGLPSVVGDWGHQSGSWQSPFG